MSKFEIGKMNPLLINELNTAFAVHVSLDDTTLVALTEGGYIN